MTGWNVEVSGGEVKLFQSVLPKLRPRIAQEWYHLFDKLSHFRGSVLWVGISPISYTPQRRHRGAVTCTRSVRNIRRLRFLGC